MSRYLHFDGMTWPDPRACDEIERELRYGTPDSIMADRMFIASIVASYSALVGAGQKTRNSHVSKMKEAMKGERG